MAGFSYDPKLYNKAMAALCDADGSFNSLLELISDVSTKFPLNYEYKNEVKDVCDNLNIDAKFVQEYHANLLKNSYLLRTSFGYEGVEESSWSQDLKYAWKATGAAWNEGITSVINGDGWGDMKEALKQTGATLGVTYTTLESGSLKVLEYLKDGKTAITGFTTAGIFKLYDLVTGDNKSKKIMDATLDDIRRDKVGELNKLFYEGTNLGKNINDASNLKYDSNGAEAMKAASEFTTKITLATGATIASGGSLAPVAAGFLYGGGKELEEYGQSVDRENGVEYSYPEAVLRGTSGAVSGSLEWWGYGSLGNFAYTGLKMIPSLKMLGSKFYLNPINSLVEKIVELSPKEIVSTTANFLKTNAPNFLKNTAPNFLKNYGKELLSKENLLPTAAVISDHVISFALGDITADEMLQNIKNELKFTAAFSTVGALTRTVSPKRIGVLDDELDRAISNCRYGGSDQSLVKELEKRGISISDFRKDTFDKFSSKLDDFFNKNGIEAKTLSNHKIITVEGLEKNSLYMLDNKFAFHTDSKGVGYCYSLADDGIFDGHSLYLAFKGEVNSFECLGKIDDVYDVARYKDTLLHKPGFDVGINQGSLKGYLLNPAKAKGVKTSEVINIIQDNIPGISKADALRFAYNIDSTGVCSYASRLNAMLQQSDICRDPQLFKDCFGFDLINPKTGNINQEYILADFYSFSNKENSGMFNFTDGKVKYLGKSAHKNQIYLEPGYSFRTLEDNYYYAANPIHEWFDSKLLKGSEKYGPQFYNDHKATVGEFGYYNIPFGKGETPITGLKQKVFQNRVRSISDSQSFSAYEFKEKLKIGNDLKVGKGIIDVIPQDYKAVCMYDLNSGNTVLCDGAHSMSVVDNVKNGYIVESWGKLYYLDKKALSNCWHEITTLNFGK